MTGTARGRRILIVDDETVLAQAIAKHLARDNYDCAIVGRLDQARARLADGGTAFDLVLLDMRLPDGDGLELLAALPEMADEPTPVVVLTAFGQIDNAVTAMKLGALDYLRKPVDLDELVLVVDRALRSEDMRHRLAYSAERDSLATEGLALIGDSPPLVATRDRIATIAGAPGDSAEPPTVLIQGETGTGKDIAARLIHAQSQSSGRPFVHVDCATLPNDLIELELFGHARGAFAAAGDARAGLIEAAEDGTVLLDEIGNIPPPLQAKLLNVIERRRMRRLGATKEIPIEARFIAATNRDLDQAVAAGSFRADLYYRLNVLSLNMPSLRDCPGDAMVIGRHFLALTARRRGMAAPSVSDGAAAAIDRYPWPGNVRELRHLIERAMLLDRDGVIDEADLSLIEPRPVSASTAAADSLTDLTLEQAERRLIAQALQRCGGNVSKAARLLGVTRMALRYRIDKHQIGRADWNIQNG